MNHGSPLFFLGFLVTGCCALLWIYGLFSIFGLQGVLRIDSTRAVLFGPAVYVVGLIVDAVSRTILMKGRKRMKGKDVHESGPLHYTEILARSSDLGKQIELRSSRDRIARGAVGNVFVATIVFTLLAARLHTSLTWYAVLLAGVVLLPVTVV